MWTDIQSGQAKLVIVYQNGDEGRFSKEVAEGLKSECCLDLDTMNFFYPCDIQYVNGASIVEFFS